jgi:hypothetical protein
MKSCNYVRFALFVICIAIGRSQAISQVFDGNLPPMFAYGNPNERLQCDGCYSFIPASCQSVYGDIPQSSGVTDCPPVECFSEGSCQLASNYSYYYDPSDWNVSHDVMVPRQPGKFGYYTKSGTPIACGTSLGCDDCVLNPNTYIMRCELEIYPILTLKQGIICYYDHDNTPYTPNVPYVCALPTTP